MAKVGIKAGAAWIEGLAKVFGEEGSKELGEGGKDAGNIIDKAAPNAAENTINTGKNVVYRSVDETGKVQYVGMTKNLERRAGDQLADKGIQIKAIPGLSNLSRADARAAEQALIEKHGIGAGLHITQHQQHCRIKSNL